MPTGDPFCPEEVITSKVMKENRAKLAGMGVGDYVDECFATVIPDYVTGDYNGIT